MNSLVYPAMKKIGEELGLDTKDWIVSKPLDGIDDVSNAELALADMMTHQVKPSWLERIAEKLNGAKCKSTEQVVLPVFGVVEVNGPEHLYWIDSLYGLNYQAWFDGEFFCIEGYGWGRHKRFKHRTKWHRRGDQMLPEDMRVPNPSTEFDIMFSHYGQGGMKVIREKAKEAGVYGDD